MIRLFQALIIINADVQAEQGLNCLSSFLENVFCSEQYSHDLDHLKQHRDLKGNGEKSLQKESGKNLLPLGANAFCHYCFSKQERHRDHLVVVLSVSTMLSRCVFSSFSQTPRGGGAGGGGCGEGVMYVCYVTGVPSYWLTVGQGLLSL